MAPVLDLVRLAFEVAWQSHQSDHQTCAVPNDQRRWCFSCAESATRVLLMKGIAPETIRETFPPVIRSLMQAAPAPSGARIPDAPPLASGLAKSPNAVTVAPRPNPIVRIYGASQPDWSWIDPESSPRRVG